MDVKMKHKRRAVVDADNCVACGCCVKVCPKDAIKVWKGSMAKVDTETCVGCGKCAQECPASVIEIKAVLS
ncbi:MAG: 4Fe-4S binding protein [Firmicutes bacterium]|jgi:NAD-dependent dihydropyrimidine dehydrogenase PreA subunit|nr:4Fe-4S binding protein [Bacillota bacterium]